METIVGKSIPVDNLTGYITSIGRCPYSPDQRFFLYCPVSQVHGVIKKPEDSIKTTVHELLHMMLHYYYENEIKQQGLSHKQFHDLKESQTIILNEEYGDVLTQGDMGYAIHENLRTLFLEERNKNKNFDDFVYRCVEIVKKYLIVK